MFAPEMYRLLDFGQGRRLEQFGPVRLDRPSPAAEDLPRAAPELWPEADAYYERGEGHEGRWIVRRPLPEQWVIGHDSLRLELKRTEFGHLGVFPEQATCWDWIAGQLASPLGSSEPRRPKVLNLFAYTGGSTLAAAAAGAEVTHVDASRPVVAWARRNAQQSGLADAPIRWIAEDALKYVRRELKRGRRYDAVILDPPSYGHGPKGEVWRLEQHLPEMLALCAELTAASRRFILLSGHTPDFGPERLARMLDDALGRCPAGSITAEELTLRTAAGRPLPSGVVVRWQE